MKDLTDGVERAMDAIYNQFETMCSEQREAAKRIWALKAEMVRRAK